MKFPFNHQLRVYAVAIVLSLSLLAPAHADELGPVSVVADPAGSTLYVAASRARQVLIVDAAAGAVSGTISLSRNPSGLALSADAKHLYVTEDGPDSRLLVIDLASRSELYSVLAGHTPMCPTPGPGGMVFVCARFNDQVLMIDPGKRQVVASIPVQRQPIACGLVSEGNQLFVANHLPVGPATQDVVAAEVEVIDIAAGKVVGSVQLPNGSSSLRGLCVSPESRHVYVTHLLSRYTMPPTQLERGWMNTNALSIIDVKRRALLCTVLLDDLSKGAANPWAVACTADGRTLCLSHAGTHEVSIIDRLGLHERLEQIARKKYAADPDLTLEKLADTLGFLGHLRIRKALHVQGPRGLTVAGSNLFVAGYFSDNLEMIAMGTPQAGSRMVALGPAAAADGVRRGERLFNDATLCYQQWQSCASCHPDARADGLNWDLSNDGLGNPKNTRSLLLAHQTSPAMSLAIRETAEHAVRSGFQFIQFVKGAEADTQAVDEYLKSLTAVQSPHLQQGRLPEAAQRGQKLFESSGCAKCHSGDWLTDLKHYDVGTATGMDRKQPIDTPTLIELWRTGPYLHDGRAATLRDVLKSCNPKDQHGETSSLTEEQLLDLEQFLLSQ